MESQPQNPELRNNLTNFLPCILSMESQPQNPELRNNPTNFHPCIKTEQLLLLA